MQIIRPLLLLLFFWTTFCTSFLLVLFFSFVSWLCFVPFYVVVVHIIIQQYLNKQQQK